MIGRYKVGSVVQVRQWDDMVKEFKLDEEGNIKIKRNFYSDEPIYLYFSKEMKPICGKEITLTGIDKEYEGYFSENCGDKNFTWCDEMLENKNKDKEQSFITKIKIFDTYTHEHEEIVTELNPLEEYQVESGLDEQEGFNWRKFKLITEDLAEWIWDECLV